MKIKMDFVTNSSSTSYLLILKNDLNEEELLEAAGVKSDSQFVFLFKDLYKAIVNSMKPLTVDQILNNSNSDFNRMPEFLKKKISNSLSAGDKVYFGKLHSESDYAESFFCCDSFIIENETIYLNAIPSGW